MESCIYIAFVCVFYSRQNLHSRRTWLSLWHLLSSHLLLLQLQLYHQLCPSLPGPRHPCSRHQQSRQPSSGRPTGPSGQRLPPFSLHHTNLLMWTEINMASTKGKGKQETGWGFKMILFCNAIQHDTSSNRIIKSIVGSTAFWSLDNCLLSVSIF